MNDQTVKAWILKAESDLKTGKDEMLTEEPATDTICFHMQQCAEKYLKAFLIFNGREIHKTHNLAEIIQDCIELDSDFKKLLEFKAHTLTDFGVEFRYPSEVLFPSLEETKEAIMIAEKVKLFVLAKLKSKGYQE